MSSYVNLKATRSRVTFVANFAGEWFVARMNKLMGFQMSLSDELFFTALEIAYKRSFSSLKTFRTFK